MPINEMWYSVWEFTINFLSATWISLLILVLVWCLGKWLHNQFDSRTQKYTKDNPNEHYWLNLQCIRWERQLNQIINAIYLTVGLKVVANIYISMSKELFANTEGAVAAEGLGANFQGLPLIELSVFVIILTFKIRGLLDAKGVYKDLVKASL